jgi:hypothetical protein
MTVKIFTVAHLPPELRQVWLQHLRDFDTAHPGCHFEVVGTPTTLESLVEKGGAATAAGGWEIMKLHLEKPTRQAAGVAHKRKAPARYFFLQRVGAESVWARLVGRRVY